ncbi:MAG: hypothetical protein SVM80_01865 [Halobacteriota archaeon]|nr:hypothetical protein [Halobacteriota archaeon]
MGVWMWRQANKKYWRVETDVINGTIKVYDENGVIISDHSDLSKEAVELMEKNFFDTVGINEKEVGIDKSSNEVEPKEEFNPMYV